MTVTVHEVGHILDSLNRAHNLYLYDSCSGLRIHVSES
jgi:tRNA(Phe) wybutosine-synthesizing methylase Tyw3